MLSNGILATFIGRYVIYGLLAALNTLDVYLEDGSLVTDGQDDISGELFPPYRTRLVYGEDGCFRWDVYPTLIEFHRGAGAGRVTLWTPGGSVYHGEGIARAPGGP